MIGLFYSFISCLFLDCLNYRQCYAFMLDKENSDNVCMVAMNAIYPFVYAFRRGGNLKNGPYQCTDCGETVKFTIETVD